VEVVKDKVGLRQMNYQPPKLATWLFARLCDDAMVEDLRGDLEEIYYKTVQKHPLKAKLNYWKQVIQLIFSYAINKRKKDASIHPYASGSNSTAMLRNYFKVAVRSLTRHRFFTIINVAGLAVGMSVSLIILSIVTDLMQFDRFHEKRERIYRVISHTNVDHRENDWASCPAPMADRLKSGYSGIEEVVRVNKRLSLQANYREKFIPLSGLFADANFFKVFTFPMVKGNPGEALQKPFSLVMTETAARKMFGTIEPIGKIISLGAYGEFEVTGIIKDHPKTSHFHFEVLASYSTVPILEQQEIIDKSSDSWESYATEYVYLLFPESAGKPDLEEQFARISSSVYARMENFKVTFDLQPLLGIVPGPELSRGIGPDFGYLPLVIMAALAVLILLPACFNYTNITISRSLKRSKEIGLRKVAGGYSSQIFLQFVLEAVVVACLALAGSFLIFSFIKREFLMIMAQDMFDLTVRFETVALFVLFALLTGLIAGGFPAAHFSRLNPVEALKKQTALRGFAKVNLQQVLIVFQFTLSLVFIMGVAIILKQHRYSLTFDFGFKRENILDVSLQGVDPQRFDAQFNKLAGVDKVSYSSMIIGTGSTDITEARRSDSLVYQRVYQEYIDHNYIGNFGLQLIAGSDFHEVADNINQGSVIVNETLVAKFGFASAADAINQQLILADTSEVRIIGVVKDFHYMHLEEPIRSFFFRYDPEYFQYANLSISSHDVQGTMLKLNDAWEEIGEGRDFQASFFDDEIRNAYSYYTNVMKIFGYLGVLAISISCLGMLGMVVFNAESRIKEIGIRKVLGATSANLVYLLSGKFLKLMLIASLVSLPIVYVLFEKLLLNLQYYRTEIGFLEIGGSILLMLLAGVATVASQTMRAARSNPADSLRCE
jgi:ABC-type antimicrobial peptide transport system permease subunit